MAEEDKVNEVEKEEKFERQSTIKEEQTGIFRPCFLGAAMYHNSLIVGSCALLATLWQTAVLSGCARSPPHRAGGLVGRPRALLATSR